MAPGIEATEQENTMHLLARLAVASLLAALPLAASARDGESWVVSWTGSVQGPYPVRQRHRPAGADLRVPGGPRQRRARPEVSA